MKNKRHAYPFAALAAAALLFGPAGCKSEEKPANQPGDPQAQTEAGQTTTETDQKATTGSGQKAASTVEVRLNDMQIDMPRTLPAGPTTFRVINAGTEAHGLEFEGNEMGRSLERELQPGETATLELELTPGNYRVYCPVDDHGERGMEIQLNVTKDAGSESPLEGNWQEEFESDR